MIQRPCYDSVGLGADAYYIIVDSQYQLGSYPSSQWGVPLCKSGRAIKRPIVLILYSWTRVSLMAIVELLAK